MIKNKGDLPIHQDHLPHLTPFLLSQVVSKLVIHVAHKGDTYSPNMHVGELYGYKDFEEKE